MSQSNTILPTIITLILPTPEGGGIAPERATATLLIQRGELAHLRQFHYNGLLADLTDAIQQASTALNLLEDHPPIISDAPPAPAKPTGKAKPEAKPTEASEPTIDIPLKKGKKTIPISHLKLTGGETDAAAYRQAVLLASKLIEGKLWDGDTPIQIADVYALAKKLQHLSERDLSMFSLGDFVQLGAAAHTPTQDAEPQSPLFSSNGHSSATGADDTSHS